MAIRTLVIGAYGNFGRIISRHLNQMPGVQLVIAGRNARQLAQLGAQLSSPGASLHGSWCGDAMAPGFAEALRQLGIDWVIHTGGPFQGQPYHVAEACIEAGASYCDLADCRLFVNGIAQLDARARLAGVALLSGCSSVPSLSSAILDEQRQRFSHIESIEHGISSSAKMPGLSTIEGVLAYAGRPIRQWRDGQPCAVDGWLGLQLRHLPGLGWRLLSNVDVPDMDIFASRYGARTLAFKAGSGLMAGGLANAALALLVKFGLVRDPLPWARRLHRLGLRFERWGDGKSAMYLDVRGLDENGQPLRLRAQVSATDDKGPEIPSCAAVALMARLTEGYQPAAGARPCVGEISVAQYLSAIDAPDKIRYSVSFQQGRG
ncbi:saccharopine dehydrogenase NADP-binding domain-containing protein [Pseudomonas sichuanensis]|uniref:saccharopine dehydrogenase family protein n=1 Tax=Pseudomonas sichuanensis TaxID=2213015 RepID=UPI00244791D9|nr:saccharopine dehydrogenase NADP-binding domain-containing protein [Pseudomonas sichuanensis]MDH0729828.1 saccharopine dehydrogenase NADP-binding domain-containing protein [Pseudomonas sichuanensis]MDH1582450.1 saccharopine dehydrogenase NADP-binding domain-containing protein [Pseudomonas sichuanensis]MDH1591199.1 saccharopine dehydrogenase NADP-binding domain-containing protein [Pseudomonas sichuanensis]MDH1597443.1 saccharopine dehydrogenase NADP-binding domain-containing protein [Pseudomon